MPQMTQVDILDGQTLDIMALLTQQDDNFEEEAT